jgi:hypothetical protein
MKTFTCGPSNFDATLDAIREQGLIVVRADVVGKSGWRLHAREALPVQSELLPPPLKCKTVLHFLPRLEAEARERRAAGPAHRDHKEIIPEDAKGQARDKAAEVALKLCTLHNFTSSRLR